jgi:hypothetical protein
MRSILLGAAVVALAAPLGAFAQDECDRACLKAVLDQYMAAQAANDAAALPPLAAGVKFTENGVVMQPGTGFFATADDTTYRLEIFDSETGGAAVGAVVKEGEASVFQLVRLKVEDGALTEIESVVGREGESGPMFAPDYATEPRREFTLSIREAEQMSRLELMAVADAYWRALETNGHDNYHPAPLLPGLLRIENGLPTTSGAADLGGQTPSGAGSSTAPQQFNTGMFESRTIYDRRFPVVDVERGVILSIARMGLKDGYETPAHWQGGRPILCEFFAIQNGQIVAIEVFMKSTVPADQSAGWPRDRLTRSISDPD